MLRAAPFHHPASHPRPVHWDATANGGTGAWTPHGCHPSQLLHGMLLFACTRLGHYALQQRPAHLNANAADPLAGAGFRHPPAALYAASAALFACCWLCIVTYAAAGCRIRMPRRARHALVNQWLALAALVWTFALGIRQTEEWRRCRAIGMALHYLSLCVLLWQCVAVSDLYKRMSRAGGGGGGDRQLQRSDEASAVAKPLGAGAGAAAPKPIMGAYLVGWGIAAIICGISGSVNWPEYADYSYCMLRGGPALSALLVPAGILCAFVALLLVGVRCALRGGRMEGVDGLRQLRHVHGYVGFVWFSECSILITDLKNPSVYSEFFSNLMNSHNICKWVLILRS